MGKTPAFQFYPADWTRDLEEHPLEIEGAWIRICCKLWWSEERGKLTKTINQWSRILREAPEKTRDILTYIFNEKIGLIVGDLTNSNNLITVVSRRMVREEKERQDNNLRQKRHYQKKKPNTQPNENLTTISSSSSSSSSSLKTLKTNTFSPDSIEIGLAEFFIQLLDQRSYPWSKRGKPDSQKWALEFDKIIRIDGRTPDSIKAVLSWCQKDLFWQDNILGPAKLREKWERLVLKMRSPGRPARPGRSVTCHFCGHAGETDKPPQEVACSHCREPAFRRLPDGSYTERWPVAEQSRASDLVKKLALAKSQ